jgi:hypothetical protein
MDAHSSSAAAVDAPPGSIALPNAREVPLISAMLHGPIVMFRLGLPEGADRDTVADQIHRNLR